MQHTSKAPIFCICKRCNARKQRDKRNLRLSTIQRATRYAKRFKHPAMRCFFLLPALLFVRFIS